jgi:hypothetical protein
MQFRLAIAPCSSRCPTKSCRLLFPPLAAKATEADRASISSGQTGVAGRLTADPVTTALLAKPVRRVSSAVEAA